MENDRSRIVTYTEYRELLDLYIKQLGRTADLQEENTALANMIEEMRIAVENLKKRAKRVL